MRNIVLMLCLATLLSCCIGCESKIVQAVFQEQELSENYALEDGVTCTSPEMIDGDMNTVGKAPFPERTRGRIVYGAFPNAEVEITLPEKKSIHRIVVYSESLEDFKVLALTGPGDNWEQLAEIDSNKEKRVEIKVSTTTDKIKIRARGKASSADDGSINTVRVAEPEIQEIELYGFASN
jgi:hypothetical protein